VRGCLEALGPWGAAAAAHLDLLSAAPDAWGDGGDDEDDDDALSAAGEALQEGADDAAGDGELWWSAAACGCVMDHEAAARL
jgi:hypothetical protein